MDVASLQTFSKKRPERIRSHRSASRSKQTLLITACFPFANPENILFIKSWFVNYDISWYKKAEFDNNPLNVYFTTLIESPAETNIGFRPVGSERHKRQAGFQDLLVNFGHRQIVET